MSNDEPAAVPPGRTAPLNLAQQGVLAGHLVDPDSAVMTIGVTSVVRPALDADRLAEATRRAYADSDGIRTLVTRIDGEWRQWVDEDADPQLTVHDVSGQSDPDAAADRLVELITGTRLRLDGTVPLTSSHLVQVGPHESRWLLVTHHVAGDGYSGMATRARIAAWYRHLGGDGPAPTPLTASVRDAWARMDAERDETTVQRWKQALSDLPERLTVADREGRPETGQHRFHEVLDPQDAALLAAGAGQGTWIHPVVAVSAAYTARVTGSEHVVLGFVVAGRSTRVEREVVTQLARIVPLPVDVAPGAGLAELTAACRRAVSRARALGAVTAEELRSAVPAAWRLGRVHGPVLNIVPFDADPSLPGHTLTSRVFNRGPVEDLHLAVAPQGTGLELDAVANAHAYTADEAARHVGRLARLARLAAASPSTPMLDLDPSLPDELAVRAAYAAATGCRLLDTAGRESLVGQVGEVTDAAGIGIGRLAMLHADGAVEELGVVGDSVVLNGFPVHLDRVRRAALAVPGVASAAVRLQGRRVHVEVTPEPDARTPDVDAVRARSREVLPAAVPVRITVDAGPA